MSSNSSSAQNQILYELSKGSELAFTKLYNRYNDGLPFEYTFINDDYQKRYAAEHRVGILSRYFAGMAVVISCLGLFGLAAFTSQRRLKEISIRKILGSSEFGIVYLLSGEFTRLVFTSVLIALPISYLITRHCCLQR